MITELLIDELPSVNESAVIAVPDADFGEAVVAVVVPQEGAMITEQEITAGLRENLARFKQPRHVVIVDTLPRNTMGKVQKKTLRETYKNLGDKT